MYKGNKIRTIYIRPLLHWIRNTAMIDLPHDVVSWCCPVLGLSSPPMLSPSLAAAI